MNTQLLLGDCLEKMREITSDSVDSIVTDPPYGLSFMGKKWDYDVPSVAIWQECLRVLKPGGHLLAFAGTRTQHRMAVRIEDAGFEIRDMIAWVYGSGFPKSLNLKDVQPGFGTALKPALEPITLARKPLIGTVVANVLEWGTGGINVDGCRVEADNTENRARPPRTPNAILGGGKGTNLTASEHNSAGRWPANLIHDGSEEVVSLFPQSKAGTQTQPLAKGGIWKTEKGNAPAAAQYGDNGSAARFFYCAKASRSERDTGCEDLGHSTPGGTCLDPFLGSGTTAVAALQEGFSVIGIERDEHSYKTAMARVAAEDANDPMFQ
jgi:site-specific DNA-methyltransferase (adenine-specific)